MGRRGQDAPALTSRTMAVTHGALASPSIADRILRAGAVMATRDGHPVAAHFGSTATELAVCVKRAGLAVRSDFDTLEVSGLEPWLSHFLAETLGAHAPSAGRAGRSAGTWCCRVAPDRAVIVGPWSAIARWTRFVREAIVTGSSLACSGRAESATALTLVGPRGERLLRDAALRSDLPVQGLHEDWFAGSPTLLLREAPDRYLIVVDPDCASDAVGELFAAGGSLGLSMVGAEALERLAAAPRALA
jgi:glycine cleavage system aminomethyltransferase T